MANIENLVPNEDRTPDERRENARKAGIASGVARRKKRDLREACLAILDMDVTTKAGDTMTGAEAMVAKLFQQAMKGNIKAFIALRDTAGQKPVEKLVVSDVDQSVINEVENMVAGATAADTTAADTTAADTTAADDDIDDVTDDSSTLARDDAPFPPPASVAGIAVDSKPATKTTRKRTTKKKATDDVNNNDSPFFDLESDDS